MTNEEIKQAMRERLHIVHTDNNGKRTIYDYIHYWDIYYSDKSGFKSVLELMEMGWFALVKVFPAEECEIYKEAEK